MKLGLISRSLEQGWFEKIHHLQDGGEKCHLQQGLGYIWCRHWGLWQEDFIAHPNIRLCHCGHRSLLRSIYALLPGRGEISRTSHAFAWFQGCLRICRQKALGGKIFSFLTAIFTWCTLKEKKICKCPNDLIYFAEFRILPPFSTGNKTIANFAKKLPKQVGNELLACFKHIFCRTNHGLCHSRQIVIA